MYRVTMLDGNTFLVAEFRRLLIFEPENKKLRQYGESWAIGYVLENGVPNENIKPNKIDDLKVGMEITLFCTIFVDAWIVAKIKKIEQIS